MCGVGVNVFIVLKILPFDVIGAGYTVAWDAKLTVCGFFFGRDRPRFMLGRAV
jgi:hypothetical protein